MTRGKLVHIENNYTKIKDEEECVLHWFLVTDYFMAYYKQAN